MSVIIDCVILGSCRFMCGTCRFGTNPERDAPRHFVLGGVLHDDTQVQALETGRETKRVPRHVNLTEQTHPSIC